MQDKLYIKGSFVYESEIAKIVIIMNIFLGQALYYLIKH